MALMQKGEQSTDQEIRTRCGIILASYVGVNRTHLATTYGTTVEHVTQVIADFNERGISSVEDSQ